MPQNDVLETAPTAVVHKPLPHDSARLHVQGSATYIDDIREPARHAARRHRHSAGCRGRTEEPRPLGGPGCARGRRGAHRGRHPRQERHRARVRRRAPARRPRDPVPRTGGVRRRRPDARRSPSRRAARPDGDRGARAVGHHRRRAGDRRARAGRLRVRPRRRSGRDRRRAASARGPVRHRRPGAFLSRGPGFPRHSRRGRRDDRSRLDPGPDRDPAHRRARSRRSRRLRHRRDAPDGRRLRRQGEPGLHLGGDRRARRAGSPAGHARSGSTATTISR